MFVDEARILVAGGRGGDGAVSFHREKYRPKGGPDGGSGGRGGSVILEADASTGSLAWLRDHPHHRAPAGRPGRSNNRSGADGEDRLLGVPAGTVVADESAVVLADLASPGDRFVAARGGRGGKGNAAYLSPARRAPGFADLGEPGEERWLLLELRLIADVAVVGSPNAGKSTLVAAVSGARPKVAAYPFTTLEPSPGVVERAGARFTICDVPGLVEGAHEGRGLGIKFLRHARRAMALLHLVDLASGRDPLGDYEKVRAEIERFDAEMASRPEVVALNKVDAAPPAAVEDAAGRFRARGIDPAVVSAKEGTGLGELLERLDALVVAAREQRRQAEGFELFRTEFPEGAGVSVEREDVAWRVRGAAVERWVATTDLANPEGVAHLQGRLERAGVERALAEAGARGGEEVRIGRSVFEWWPGATAPPETPARGRGRGD